MIEHKNFVCFVLVNVQLGEDFVYLDVCCWHTYSVPYVTSKVFLYRTQINQQNFAFLILGIRLFAREKSRP